MTSSKIKLNLAAKQVELEARENIFCIQLSTLGVTDENTSTERYALPEGCDEICVLPDVGPVISISAEANRVETLEKLVTDQRIETVFPVFSLGNGSSTVLLGNGSETVLRNRLLVGFNSESGANGIIQRENLEILERFGENEFLLSHNQGDADSTAVILERLNRDNSVEYAEPDFTFFTGKGALIEETGSSARDPLFREQWAIVKVAAEEAWRIQPRYRDVTIAVLDVGVDTKHPDIKNTVVGSYNATNGTENQDPQPWEYHGTVCAGIMIAEHDNNTGLKGVAGGCGLLAVKVANQTEDNSQWIWSASDARRGFEWAWKHGASVISNSWEASWDGEVPSKAVSNEIDRARKFGRNGKGCVVVCSSGNSTQADADDKRVVYPATLPEVLAVSATNGEDEFKSHESSDGDTRWGSRFGPEVDIAAPGVRVYTTDMHGDAGIVPRLVPGEDSDYYKMNGTSISAPIVAGIAAMVICANPELTEKEVREIILKTADKVPRPDDFDHGRNDKMGFGRANALRAVQKAKKLRGVE